MKELDANYIFDSNSRIWTRHDLQPFAYADGSEIKLRNILLETKDKSVFSSGLQSRIGDWATTYHFSSSRANLLRPFEANLLKGRTVLELGCGCGAITRYLGETAKEVVGVEGSKSRAAIAALRCNDLPNVHIVADRIQNLPAGLGKYDVVTLIGVLEYSRCYGIDETTTLELARSFLKESGVLILAIENRLGLKYFAGIPEDHLHISWAGIVGGYAENGAVTYSRKQIITFLIKAGFSHNQQFMPVPDYKLPRCVITQAGLKDPLLNVEALLSQKPRSHEEPPLFNMHGAWASVIQAGLLPDLADSLCFISSPGDFSVPPCEKDLLAQHYGNMFHSSSSSAKMISIWNKNGTLRVSRVNIFEKQLNASCYTQVMEDEPYYFGPRVLDLLYKCLCQPGWGLADIASTLAPWVETLKKLQSSPGLLPGKYADLIPANIIVGNDGETHPFDLEWQKKDEIPLGWVLARGVLVSLGSCSPVAEPRKMENLQFRLIVESVFAEFDIKYDMERIAQQWEDFGLEKSLGLSVPSYELLLTGTLWPMLKNIGEINRARAACQEYGTTLKGLPQFLQSLTKNFKSMHTQLQKADKFIKSLKNGIKRN